MGHGEIIDAVVFDALADDLQIVQDGVLSSCVP